MGKSGKKRIAGLAVGSLILFKTKKISNWEKVDNQKSCAIGKEIQSFRECESAASYLYENKIISKEDKEVRQGWLKNMFRSGCSLGFGLSDKGVWWVKGQNYDNVLNGTPICRT